MQRYGEIGSPTIPRLRHLHTTKEVFDTKRIGLTYASPIFFKGRDD